MKTEGALARIRYLEGMLRSLEMELKRLRSGRVTTNVAASATAATPTSPPRPVFLRDLSSDLVQDGASVCNTLEAKVEAELFSCDDDTDEIAALRNQIAWLGNSLAESETERANLLDEFQRERLQCMSQFERMSEMLKQLTEGTRTEGNHPT